MTNKHMERQSLWALQSIFREISDIALEAGWSPEQCPLTLWMRNSFRSMVQTCQHPVSSTVVTKSGVKI